MTHPSTYARSCSPHHNFPPARPSSPNLINKPEPSYVTPGNPEDKEARLTEVGAIFQKALEVKEKKNKKLEEEKQELQEIKKKLETQIGELQRTSHKEKEETASINALNRMLLFCIQPGSSTPSVSKTITKFLFQITELEREIHLNKEELESFVKRFSNLNIEVVESDIMNQLIHLNLNFTQANNNERDTFIHEVNFLLKRIRYIGKRLLKQTIKLDPNVKIIRSPKSRIDRSTSYRIIPLYPNLGESIDGKFKVTKDILKIPETWKFEKVTVPEEFRKKDASDT